MTAQEVLQAHIAHATAVWALRDGLTLMTRVATVGLVRRATGSAGYAVYDDRPGASPREYVYEDRYSEESVAAAAAQWIALVGVDRALRAIALAREDDEPDRTNDAEDRAKR